MCGDCKQNVYNLSDMTRGEAEALIAATVGRLCIRYFQRTDGTILLKDCTIGIARRRRKRVIAAGVAAGLAGSLLGYKALRGDPPASIVISESALGDVVGGSASSMNDVEPPVAEAVKMGQMIEIKGGL